MSVTTAIIGIVSKYVLGTDYTEEEFEFFKGCALEQFANENPGLSTYQADKAVAYLICHQIYVKSKGSSDKLSQKIGDTYITYAQHIMPSSYLAQYYELIKQNAGGQPYRGVQRGDSPTSRDFQLSDQKVPSMDNTDLTLGS
jgi:hypothetical protein